MFTHLIVKLCVCFFNILTKGFQRSAVSEVTVNSCLNITSCWQIQNITFKHVLYFLFKKMFHVEYKKLNKVNKGVRKYMIFQNIRNCKHHLKQSKYKSAEKEAKSRKS